MARFNLVKLATSLVPLIHKQLGEDEADSILVELNARLNIFTARYESEYHQLISAKLGLPNLSPDVLESFLKALELARIDYTLFFRELCDCESDDIDGLFERVEPAGDTSQLREWLMNEYSGVHDQEAMKKVNPRYTLRNRYKNCVLFF